MIRNFEKLLTDHPDMCCEVEPKDYPPYLDYPKERKPMTNYDRLISKTPEELVEWIESIEPAACPWRDDHGDNCRFTHCRDCWLSWLKSPMNLEAGK